MLDDRGASSVLFLVFRGGEALGTKIFVIEGREKIVFRVLTVRLNVID